MKISLVNDCHNEFQIWSVVNPDNADVLVLAGDIVPVHLLKDPKDGEKHTKFFEDCGKLYKDVIYIFGNHELYFNDLATAFDVTKEHLKHISNLHLVNNEVVEINDVAFFCGTMWSDANREDPMTMLTLTQSMNDYRYIKNTAKKSHYSYDDIIDPEDTVAEFKLFKKFLIKTMPLYQDKKCVVVSHHAPTFRAIPEEYKRDYHLNGGFASNLDELILNRPFIKYWLYGHSHSPKQFCIGETTLINNARGYVGYERGPNNIDPYLPKTIEV